MEKSFLTRSDTFLLLFGDTGLILGLSVLIEEFLVPERSLTPLKLIICKCACPAVILRRFRL